MKETTNFEPQLVALLENTNIHEFSCHSFSLGFTNIRRGWVCIWPCPGSKKWLLTDLSSASGCWANYILGFWDTFTAQFFQGCTHLWPSPNFVHDCLLCHSVNVISGLPYSISFGGRGLCQTFLILLYCRNYLRKSRHLESDGQIPCSFGSTPTMRPDTLADTECTTAPATPRDILSFAWQISKGMAYLSDIKVCTTVPWHYQYFWQN